MNFADEFHRIITLAIINNPKSNIWEEVIINVYLHNLTIHLLPMYRSDFKWEWMKSVSTPLNTSLYIPVIPHVLEMLLPLPYLIKVPTTIIFLLLLCVLGL